MSRPVARVSPRFLLDRRPLLESLRRFQPDQFPASSPLGGQPAALRVPYAPCIPPGATRVSPADIIN